MLLRSLVPAMCLAACGLDSFSDPVTSGEESSESPAAAPEARRNRKQIIRGREIWLNRMFGGEKFWGVILPNPPFNLTPGFDVAFRSPRDTRFRDYGLINEPGCIQGDASTDFYDRCPDPESTGVVGFRKKVVQGPSGTETLIGFSCAGCHAGLDPENPPADPNHPRWENIHLTIGNQYIQLDKLFSAHIPSSEPRWQVLHSWAPGTADTSSKHESDGINNPGIITQFWNFPDRPFFDQTDEGTPIRVHRAGQGGEDDVGCEKAALRVYFNIGMCVAECVLPHVANGPGGTQTPIDDAECATKCPEYVAAKAAVVDECAFVQSTKPPRLAAAPGGWRYIDYRAARRGRHVFRAACASCHSNGERGKHNILSDDLIHPMEEIGTNSCRARTTNWTEGHIWAQFSSDQYKARPTGGPGYYRDVPLRGVWATAPFLHTNRLGLYNGDPSVAGRIAAYEDAMDQLLNPSKRDLNGSIQVTTEAIQVPAAGGSVTLPAGTPVGAFANISRFTGQNQCPDYIENKGHTFGEALSARDKYALTEYLKTQ